MKKLVFLCFLVISIPALAQVKLSERLAHTVMNHWKDSFSVNGYASKWSYDMGVVLKGMENLWQNTGDVTYFNYIQMQMNYYVNEDGSIKSYKPDEFNIDHINNGKQVLLMYKILGKEKFLKAANMLREQLKKQPRTNEGGFWHKKIYPYQMWLDGLYMGEPFYAEYAQLMHEDAAFDDIANQFIWMEKHARDPQTGLLYHAWDESKQQAWANKETGCSSFFWARAIGWYANALVDVLDYFPASHPKRQELINILNRLVNAVEKEQDPTTGLWYDILHYSGPGKEKNYFEASASSQFVYAIAKGVRLGYLPAAKLKIAEKGYKGINEKFIKEENGQTNLYGTVKVSGLGGNPYRDGSFNYYMSEPVIVNDAKGVGACLLAATEMELIPTLSVGKGKSVVLDRYFNSEKRKDATGTQVYWHYIWEERSHPGFSTWGKIFTNHGAKLKTLDEAPTAEKLKGANVYIIVDADHVKDNPVPNPITDKDAKAIAAWVKQGGVLLLMGNDSANCDLQGFNRLSKLFGIGFTDISANMVKNDNYPTGAVVVEKANEVFQPVKMYLKEISLLEVKSPARLLVKNGNDNVMAVCNYGKGKVLVLGDPWIYNEYIDGRKLPAEYQNYKAATDLVKWLLK